MRRGGYVAAALTVGVAALIFLLAARAQADVVYLKNGSHFEGVVTRETDTEVVLATERGTMQFPRADVERIEKKPFTRVEIPRTEPAPAAEAAPPAAAAPPTAPSTPAKPEAAAAATPAPAVTFGELREVALEPSDRWMQVLISPAAPAQPQAETTPAPPEEEAPPPGGLEHRGYEHTVIEVLPGTAGYRVTKESVLLLYSLKLQEFSVLEVEVDRKFQPVKFAVEFLARREHKRVEGEKKDDKLVITTLTEEAPEPQVREVPYPSGYLALDGSLQQLIASGGLKVGVKQQYKYFDLAALEPAVDQLEVLRQESIPVEGRTTNSFVVDVRTLFKDTPPADVLYWITQPEDKHPASIVRAEPREAPFRYELTSQEEATRLIGEIVRDLGLRDLLFKKAAAQ
jgi:hypothetical protein